MRQDSQSFKVMFNGGRWGQQPNRTPNPSNTSSSTQTQTRTKSNSDAQAQPQLARLSDDEMRQRIFCKLCKAIMMVNTDDIQANAAVLFPSSSTHLQNTSYEIVYGCSTKAPEEQSSKPWQYAMLVRRNPNGDFTPLIKGSQWSTEVPWSRALQGLLDTTAIAIHKKLGNVQMPPLGVREDLPRYSPNANANATTQ